MRKIEEHAETLVQAVGSIVKGLLGKEAQFIVVPVVETDEGIEIAVMSSMSKSKTAFIASQVALQTLKNDEDSDDDESCDCPKCQAKKFEGNVVDISESKSIH